MKSYATNSLGYTHKCTLLRTHIGIYGPQCEQGVLWLSKHGATAAVEPHAATQEGSLDHIINHTALYDRTFSVCVCVLCVLAYVFVVAWSFFFLQYSSKHYMSFSITRHTLWDNIVMFTIVIIMEIWMLCKIWLSLSHIL